MNAAAVPGPHVFLVGGAEAWRNDLGRAQASLAFRMQYEPHALAERMALFWHNVFATGNHKVANASLMVQQYATFRAHGLDRFDDLLVLVSKDPAMCIWLDSVQNDASGTNVPNENYAREVMELYSLGADNGYSQDDIAQLARALAGWSFTVAPSDVVQDPTSPGSEVRRASVFGWSTCILRGMRFRLRIRSVVSSIAPGIGENSCSTPSTRTAVTAAPSMLDKRTRRRALPTVVAKPRSKGWA